MDNIYLVLGVFAGIAIVGIIVNKWMSSETPSI